MAFYVCHAELSIGAQDESGDYRSPKSSSYSSSDNDFDNPFDNPFETNDDPSSSSDSKNEEDENDRSMKDDEDDGSYDWQVYEQGSYIKNWYDIDGRVVFDYLKFDTDYFTRVYDLDDDDEIEIDLYY